MLGSHGRHRPSTRCERGPDRLRVPLDERWFLEAVYRRVILGDTFVHMKTMIDVDDEALARAAKELGTTTKRDTVNTALRFAAERRRRVEELLDDPFALGVGADISDPDVMKHAHR